MALVARDRTGKGQRIEVPMHSAMFSAIGRHLVKLYDINPPDLFDLPRNVMSHQYKCADGRYFQSHGMYQRFVGQLMAAAGRPEWIEDLEDLYGADVAPETVAMWKDRFEKMYLENTAKECPAATRAFTASRPTWPVAPVIRIMMRLLPTDACDTRLSSDTERLWLVGTTSFQLISAWVVLRNSQAADHQQST